MGTTPGTHDLGSYHTVALVYLLFHTCFIYWSPEAGPAGARIEFGVGGKEAVATSDTLVDALVLAVAVLARKRRFSALIPAYFVLLSGQVLFVIRLVYHTTTIFHLCTLLILVVTFFLQLQQYPLGALQL
jgi:hypothetical protein